MVLLGAGSISSNDLWLKSLFIDDGGSCQFSGYLSLVTVQVVTLGYSVSRGLALARLALSF